VNSKEQPGSDWMLEVIENVELPQEADSLVLFATAAGQKSHKAHVRFSAASVVKE